jgi:hypothetical protein
LRRHAALRLNTDSDLDLEHLAEEVADFGDNTIAVVEAAIVQIVVHLLKLEWSPEADPRGHWEDEVQGHRVRAARRLRRSPSLRGRLDPADLYEDARVVAATGLARDGVDAAALPEECPYALEQILDPAWWPASRHGLD